MLNINLINEIKSYFSVEISNNFEVNGNELIVKLTDGTRVKVVAKKVA